jgi:N6-adenosine-specific RNA methylase IME4
MELLIKCSVQTPPLPEGKYQVIYCDPPWKYSNSGFSMSANRQYPTMSIDELEQIDVKSLADTNAVIFMWATNPQLQNAMRLMNSWGFEYKTNIVWVKDRHTYGFYVFGKHELLLIGTKGSMLPKKRVYSVIYGENKIHSKKPWQVYEIIEQMYPNMNYIELFARNLRPGWTSWGNEVPGGCV